jgi:hypothetical protein
MIAVRSSRATTSTSCPSSTTAPGLLHSAWVDGKSAGTFVDESGEPFGAGLWRYTDTIGLGGGYNNRANVVGKIHYHHKVGDWFTNGRPIAEPILWLLRHQVMQADPNLGFGDGKRDTFVGPWPCELHDLALQELCDDGTGSLRVPRGIVQHLQPHGVQPDRNGYRRQRRRKWRNRHGQWLPVWRSLRRLGASCAPARGKFVF